VRWKVLLIVAIIAVLAISATAVEPASANATQGWNKVQNPDFDSGTNSWSFSNWGGSTYYAGSWVTTATAYDPMTSATASLGNVLEIRQQENGGGNKGASIETQSFSGNGIQVDSATTVYGVMAGFFANGQCSHDVGVGVQFTVGGTTYDLEYYVNDNNGVPDSSYVSPSVPASRTQFIAISQGSGWGSTNQLGTIGSNSIFVGVSDGVGAGRRILTDIENEFYGGSSPPSTVYINNVHLWAYASSGLLEEDCFAEFKGIVIGEYPSPTLTVSNTVITDSGYGLSTSTTLTLSDGGTPSEGGNIFFPSNGWFAYNPVSFRGSISYKIMLNGGTYSWQASSHIINVGDINRGYYSTSGTVTCGDGVAETATGSQILEGYALHVSANWNGIDSYSKSTNLHYKQFGNWATPIAVGTSTVTVVIDPGSNAYLDTPASPGTYCQISNDPTTPTSWTPSGSSSQTVNYYEQYEAEWSPSGMSSSYPTNVYATQFGRTTTYSSVSSAFNTWVDASGSTNLWMDDPLTVTANQEQYSSSVSQWTVSLSSPYSSEYVASAPFYLQWKPTAAINGLLWPNSVTATYTQDGSSVSKNNLYSSWSDWVDNGSLLSFSPDAAQSTQAERWHAYGSSWTITSAITPTLNYIDQYYVTLNPTDELSNPLERTVSVQFTGDNGGNGANGTYTTTFSAPWSRWMNAGSTLSIGKLASGSNSTDQWYCYDGSLNGTWRQQTVSASGTYTLTFYHQFRPDIELYSTLYGQEVYDNAWHLSPYDWIQASAFLVESDSQPPIVGTYTFTFTDPSNVTHVYDGSTTGSCFYQIPQARGAWVLRVTWDDGSGTTIFNETVGFYVWDYSPVFQSLSQSGSNLNFTIHTAQLGGSPQTILSYGYLIALTGGSGTGVYTNATSFTFGVGNIQAQVTSVSTTFFFATTGTWMWSAYIRNLDPNSGHEVGVSIVVVDPLTGYVYTSNTIHLESLAIGGEGIIQVQFNPSPNWCKYGLFRVYYRFLIFDVSGTTLQASRSIDYGDSSPLSWIMRGSGTGQIEAVYYLNALHNSTVSAQVPDSLLSSCTTAQFYVAFEDSYALSTQGQISPAVMDYVNITFAGGNIFATGCTPPSEWVTQGTNATISVNSPFYPEPPYYSNTTRFILSGWKWSYASSQQWVFCNTTTITVLVSQPVQLVAWWRTQFLVEFTPYVPTTAPTDIVQVSYTANNTLISASVGSGSTLSVWVDNGTQFTMQNLWVNDYTWYAVNYEQPSKTIVGGLSLALDYVEKTNQVSTIVAESKSFEAGGTLQANVTLTTTFYNAAWINATIIVASRNTVLVDRNGVTWSNIRIPLQNNTATIKVLLPQDIGNGTLILRITAYGKVEPATTQTVLTSSAAPPQQGGGGNGAGTNLAPTIVMIGVAFGVVFAASVSIKVIQGKRRRRGRDSHVETEIGTREGETAASVAPTASTVMRRGSRVAELQLLSLVKAVALMELDVEKGVQLRVLQEGDSRFIRFLKRDATRCDSYFDAARKSYPGTISITRWGDQITFIPYSKRGGTGRGRRMKSILIVSSTRKLQDSEVEELKKSMLTKRTNTRGETS
jgi:hypothetical protein